MKSTKTVLAVAIVVAGFAYAVGAGHPQIDSLKHSRCCGPQPEDIRMYRVLTSSGAHVVIIPEAEGPNGFIITHVRRSNGSVFVFQDTGEGPAEILRFPINEAFGLTAGVPLVTGSTITVIGNGGGATATIIGYVY